jgi:hypothetical protein
MSDSPSSPKALIAALEGFVLDNDDLAQIEARVGRFNLFDALGVVRRELQHSNFLAFLLDPAESHGLSDLFLRPVLMDVLRTTPASRRPVSPVLLDGADFRGVEVRREWRNIDLLVICDEPGFVLAFENKVDSVEHSGQLARYRSTVEAEFPGHRHLYVYLTPAGDEPTEVDWVPYSYSRLHTTLSRIRDAGKGSIGSDVQLFLDHYLSLIETHFMDDPQLDELCRKIWKNHRVALKLIYDRVGNPGSLVLADVEEVIREDGGWHVFYRDARCVGFVPEPWLNWLPEQGRDPKYGKAWVPCLFDISGGEDRSAVRSYIEVQPMKDAQLRTEVIQTMLEHAGTIGLRARAKAGITGEYTRISGAERIYEWDEGSEPDPKAVRDATKKSLSELRSRLQRMEPILREVVERRASPGGTKRP